MYEVELGMVGTVRVVANIHGVSDTEELDVENFKVRIHGFDEQTYTSVGAFDLDLNAARKLYEQLASLSLVRDAEATGTLRFAEVGENGLSHLLLEQINENADLFDQIASGNPAAVAAFVESKLQAQDVVALAFRRGQLAEMEKLIEDAAYFDAVHAACNGGREKVWQEFFERNPWILGHGLDTVSFGPLSNDKLEMVTTGFSVVEAGKRADALLASLGRIRSLCFVELKHHRTELLKSGEYRPDVYAPSTELVGAVAQSQKTVLKAMGTIRQKLELVDEDKFLTGEVFYNYAPRSYVIVGSTGAFLKDDKVHQERLASFELYRRNTGSPLVLTFDELLERARAVLDSVDSVVDDVD